MAGIGEMLSNSANAVQVLLGIGGVIWGFSKLLAGFERDFGGKIEKLGEKVELQVNRVVMESNARDEKLELKLGGLRTEFEGKIGLLEEQLSKARHDLHGETQRAMMGLEGNMVRKETYQEFERFVRDGLGELKKTVERGETEQRKNSEMLCEVRTMLRGQRNAIGGHGDGDGGQRD